MPGPRLRSAALLAAASAMLALPGTAQDPASPEIRIAALAPFADATRPLRVVVQVLNTSEIELEALRLRVEIYSRVFSRSQLRGALDARPDTALLRTVSEPAGEPLAPGVQREIILERDTEALEGTLTRTGVYPLGIVVSWSGGEARLATALPYLDESPEHLLNVAWLLPVSRPVALRGDGIYPDDAITALSLEQLRQQMDVIAARPGVPVTLVPQGALADTLADLADGFVRGSSDGAIAEPATAATALAAAGALASLGRAAEAVGEVASTTYTEADLGALALRGPQSDLVRQITEGRRAVEQHLGITPSFRFLVPPGGVVGALVAETLSTLGIEGVLIDQASLPQPPPTPAELPELRYDLFGPSQPIPLGAGTTSFAGLPIDSDMRGRLDGPEQGVLLAQAIIAESAASWNELPSLSDQRVLIVTSSGLPTPPALGAALDGLAGAPWVRLLTASDASAAVPATGAPHALPRLRPPDQVFLNAARGARRSLQLLEAVAVEPHAQAAAWERAVLLAESSAWALDPETGAALARGVSADIDEVLGGLLVAPGRLVTLTSRAGVVPVTVLNQSGFPMRVQVRVQSAKVRFPGGDRRTIDITGPTTLDFAVESRAAGAFPLEVLIETSDGRVVLERGRVVLRSTAVSVVALAAVGGSALFLAVAWVRRIRRRRRGLPMPAGEGAPR